MSHNTGRDSYLSSHQNASLIPVDRNGSVYQTVHSQDTQNATLPSHQRPGGQLQNVGLSGHQLQSVGLSGGQLQSVGLSSGQLQSVGLSGGQLHNVGLSGGQLQTVSLSTHHNMTGDPVHSGLSANQQMSFGQVKNSRLHPQFSEQMTGGQVQNPGLPVQQHMPFTQAQPAGLHPLLSRQVTVGEIQNVPVQMLHVESAGGVDLQSQILQQQQTLQQLQQQQAIRQHAQELKHEQAFSSQLQQQSNIHVKPANLSQKNKSKVDTELESGLTKVSMSRNYMGGNEALVDSPVIKSRRPSDIVAGSPNFMNKLKRLSPIRTVSDDVNKRVEKLEQNMQNFFSFMTRQTLQQTPSVNNAQHPYSAVPPLPSKSSQEESNSAPSRPNSSTNSGTSSSMFSDVEASPFKQVKANVEAAIASPALNSDRDLDLLEPRIITRQQRREKKSAEKTQYTTFKNEVVLSSSLLAEEEPTELLRKTQKRGRPKKKGE